MENNHSPGPQRPAPKKRAGAGTSRVFYSLATAVLLCVIAYYGRGVIIPLIVAGFLGFLIYTLKTTIEATPAVGRFLPHWLSYILSFMVIISAFVLFIEIIRDNVNALIEAWPQYEARLKSITRQGIDFIRDIDFLPEDLLGGVEEVRGRAISMVNPILGEIGSSVRNFTGSFITIFLYTVFLLLERGRLFHKISLLSRAGQQRAAVNETIAEIATMVRQYITVKTTTNFITAMVSYAIMRFMGIDFAGFWALLIFALNYIPIIGAASAISLPVLLALVQPEGGGLRTALISLALLVGAEQTMSSVIEPRLIGRSLNLSPLVILLSLSVWGTIWGFAGMLLAVPITVTCMIILTQFRSTRPIAIMMSDNGRIADLKHSLFSDPPTSDTPSPEAQNIESQNLEAQNIEAQSPEAPSQAAPNPEAGPAAGPAQSPAG